MTTPDSQQSTFSANSYFGTQFPPPNLEDDIAAVRSFIHRQRDLGRKVVLVTVSVALILRLSAQNLCQERRDNCTFGAQRVSVVPCISILRIQLIPVRLPGCAFWITSAPVGNSWSDAMGFRRLTHRQSPRHSWRNVCRVFSRGRLCCHFYAQTV